MEKVVRRYSVRQTQSKGFAIEFFRLRVGTCGDVGAAPMSPTITLENVFQRELHDAGITRAADLAELRTGDIADRIHRPEAVGDVEYFPSELDALCLFEFEITGQADVEVPLVRACHRSCADIAKCAHNGSRECGFIQVHANGC